MMASSRSERDIITTGVGLVVVVAVGDPCCFHEWGRRRRRWHDCLCPVVPDGTLASRARHHYHGLLIGHPPGEVNACCVKKMDYLLQIRFFIISLQ